jgi:hypothetical protein
MPIIRIFLTPLSVRAGGRKYVDGLAMYSEKEMEKEMGDEAWEAFMDGNVSHKRAHTQTQTHTNTHTQTHPLPLCFSPSLPLPLLVPFLSPSL